MLPFLLFCPRWFILVKLWLFSFPGTNLTSLANSCCHSQYATKPLCGQSRSCIYEFLAENCEFSVTILLLLLFQFYLTSLYTHFLMYPKRLQGTFLLCPQFSWHPSWWALIPGLMPWMFPHGAIHRLARAASVQITHLGTLCLALCLELEILQENK